MIIITDEQYGKLRLFDRDSRVIGVEMEEILQALPHELRTSKDVAARVEVSFTFWDRPYSSSWTEHKPSEDEKVGEILPYAGILADRELADVILECQGTEHPTHSLILKSKSSLRQSMGFY